MSLAGSTGNITFDATANGNALNSVTGGSGRDTITFSNAVNNSATATVNLGAGNDTLNFNNGASAAAGATTITLGAGGDASWLRVAATSLRRLGRQPDGQPHHDHRLQRC